MTDETIFAAALEKADAVEQSAYLAAVCADDPDQRKRVEGLLAALEKAGRFLERPAVAPNTDFFSAGALHAPNANDSAGISTHDEEAEATDFLRLLAPTDRPDSLGRIGQHEVLEVLGRGGFGVVFRVFDNVLQRVVAVKMLAPTLGIMSPARKRFLREARSAASIQHENVVRIYDTGEEPLPYLVMEFISGKTLQQRIDRAGPLEVTDVLKIARQIAEGLSAAHEQGLIHRDIKPSNILIDASPQQQVKITDFGLARAVDDASLTRSGTVAGTPMYMAPEQARGETLDHRADLFSLGSVLYTMLTGRPPFRAETTLAVLKRVADDYARPIRDVIPEVPDWLCRIVDKLHAKNPAERFQSAREVADLLGQYLAHTQQPALVPIPEGIVTPAEEWLAGPGRPRPGLLALYSGIILVVAIAVLALWSLAPDTIDQSIPPSLATVPLSIAVGAIPSVVGVWCVWWWLWADYYRLGLHKKRDRSAPLPRPKRRKWMIIALLILASLLAGLIGFQKSISHYVSNRGELVLEDVDPDFDITVVQKGEVIHDRSTQRSFELKAGTTTLIRVARTSTGQPLFQKDFVIARGEQFPINIGKELAAIEQRNREQVSSELGRITGAVRAFQNDDSVPLFNGEDLTGWIVKSAQADMNPFSIIRPDGVLVARSSLKGRLLSSKTYGDFVLELECRPMANALRTKGSLCGELLFHVPSTDATEGGCRLAVVPGGNGTLECSGVSRPFDWSEFRFGDDDWNQVRIESRNGKWIFALNGTKVCECPQLQVRNGHLGIQAVGVGMMYRNIRIQEFPSSDRPLYTAP